MVDLQPRSDAIGWEFTRVWVSSPRADIRHHVGRLRCVISKDFWDPTSKPGVSGFGSRRAESAGEECCPYLPPQVSEADVELVLLARLLLISAAVFCEGEQTDGSR